MKTAFTFLFTVLFVLSIAQERKPDTVQKTDGEIQGRCMTITGATNIGDVVEAIVGAGITYSNVTFQGILGTASVATIGFFSGADCVPLGFNEGILLSSGFVSGAVGPNIDDEFSNITNTPGDADLQTLVASEVMDATWIKFDFVPTGNTIIIRYVFGSDEYNEYVGGVFNDVFGVFVNGVNIALIPATSLPVTINNVNLDANSSFYRNNCRLTFVPPTPFNIEADGMTTVLTATATVTPNVTNTIKIGIADTYDPSVDSWVFVEGESLTVVNNEIPVSNWALYLGILLMITFVVIRFRRMM